MKKLLSIIGPTATGKTKFALEIAQQFQEKFSSIDIISVDSRQIYQGMEIGTGVDVPADFRSIHTEEFAFPFFVRGKVRLHGVSIIMPDQEWSVMQFQEFTQKIIQQSMQNDGLPILVGGTGFYQKHMSPEHDQMAVPPNEEVRTRAAQMPLHELQQWAEQTNAQRFSQMNESDRQNPRRLVRVIEIGVANTDVPREPSAASFSPEEIFTLVLTDSIEHIQDKIIYRVQDRYDHGMREEVEKLIAKYSDEVWKDMPAFSATGYKEMRAFIEEKFSKEEMLELWNRRELQYAKRQLTWLKKYAKDAHWFAVDQPNWQTEALQEIQTWLY